MKTKYRSTDSRSLSARIPQDQHLPLPHSQRRFLTDPNPQHKMKVRDWNQKFNGKRVSGSRTTPTIKTKSQYQSTLTMPRQLQKNNNQLSRSRLECRFIHSCAKAKIKKLIEVEELVATLVIYQQGSRRTNTCRYPTPNADS